MKIVTTRYRGRRICELPLGDRIVSELIFDESEKADREIRSLIDALEKALTERLRERRRQRKIYKVLPVQIGETRVHAVVEWHDVRYEEDDVTSHE